MRIYINSAGQLAMNNMITLDEFLDCANSDALRRDIRSNPEQYRAVTSDKGRSLKVIAGPGSGKTTVLVLRILKLIYVDDVQPSSIFATTFTKKAAEEITSRIEGWGETIRRETRKLQLSDDIRTKIDDLNFSKVVCGTLDSIAEQALVDNREPAEAPPVVIDESVSLALMNRFGYMGSKVYQVRSVFDAEMRALYGEKVKYSDRDNRLLDINSRLTENMVSLDSLSGYPCILKCLREYNKKLNDDNLVDYPMLERKYLDFIKKDQGYSDQFGYVFVDEYQDTNILQEAIYKRLIGAAIEHSGSCMIVGDDDQSIYRFRGSRVYLFRDLEVRMKDAGVVFDTVELSDNYRSTPNIVDFFNGFISLDDGLQDVRLKKPRMVNMRKDCENFPILGMFRDDPASLANDLSDFIYSVLKGEGYTFKDDEGKIWTIKGNGEAADIVLLMNSPAEYSVNKKQRLPYYLKKNLENKGIITYNPRGQKFQETAGVALICGLTLLCIDPGNHITTGNDDDCAWVPSDVYSTIAGWRMKAEDYIRQCEIEVGGVTLKEFVSCWQSLKPLNGNGWKDDVSIIDLMKNLMAWIPSMNKSLDGLVYQQAVTSAADKSVFVNNYDRKIVYEKVGGKYVPNFYSIKRAIQDIFVPIASGSVKIDEELMGDEPYNRINIMSIHQAKGLEFPITIVDVASDFKINAPKQLKKRYPSPGDHDETSSVEDLISKLSPANSLGRSQVDRCFDDLYRKYYVAFSRAQDVLLLVGLRRSIYENKGKAIPNVGTGWNRDNVWVWGSGLKNLNIKLI